MAKTRAIVKRRKAIRNIRKITRTMELIATARYKKAMDRAVEADAFTRKIRELVASLSHSEASSGHPLLEARPETNRSVLLVLTANRGFCGGYNANVLRQAVPHYNKAKMDHEVEFEIAGKRGINYVKFQNIQPERTYLQFEDKPTFQEVEELADRYINRYRRREIDRLEVVYTRFLSVARQEAVIRTLLPMSATDDEQENESEEGDQGATVDYEFYPSAEDILNEIVPVSFKVGLYKCFLDAAVSEQISRMVAMKGATENAGNLIKSLTMKYNRARQSQITSELSEIIGTAEALN